MRALLRNLRGGLRLSLLARVDRNDFAAGAEAFAVLYLLNLAILFVTAYADVGSRGQLSYQELPRALMAAPLILAFGLLAARVAVARQVALDLAVAVTAAAATINAVMGLAGLLAKHFAVPGNYWQYLYYFSFAWWTVTIVAAVVRLTPTDPRRRAGIAAAGLALVLAPAWWLPQGPLWVPAYDPERGEASWALANERGFYSQLDVLPGALAAIEPGRPGIADMYLVVAGLYAREDVFMKEVLLIDRLFRDRFDADGRTLILVNNPRTLDAYPLASLTSLAAALKRVGEVMDPDEDVLVLYLSSHGSETHRLAVDFWPLRLDSIDPPALKKVLDAAGIKWKVVVVSACFSGGFVDPLKDDFTAVITASSATKKSFGCGTESDATYLARALFDEALRSTYSFEEAFEGARRSIEARERGQGQIPSEPQIHMGAALRGKLAEIERRLASRQPRPPAGAEAAR